MKKIPVVLIAATRLARIAFHLVKGALIVLLVFPRVTERERRLLKQRWSGQVLDIFGIERRVQGIIDGTMRVANHVSWLDIFVINAEVPSIFVAKDEVRGWPLIGWLSARTDTIFMRRDARKAARRTAQQVAVTLESGAHVVIFPEGTTSDGRQVLPFYSALLQAAVDSGTPVQPVLIRYERACGTPSDSPVFCGDTSLLESMWRIACAQGEQRFSVRVVLLPACSTKVCERRVLADRLWHDIVRALADLPSAPAPCDRRCVRQYPCSCLPSPRS